MEEEYDIDVESSEEVPDIGFEATTSTYDEGFHDSEDGLPKNDKREHHNLLERKRRDHIKDSFYGLRDCIPQLRGEKVSRAHILNKATEYIRSMQKCGSYREGEIVSLRLKNEVLEEQIQALESAKATGADDNAEAILEAAQEKVEAKHKEQQKKTSKINSLATMSYCLQVSEKNDADGRSKSAVLTGFKGLDRNTAAHPVTRTQSPVSTGSTKGFDSAPILHNPPAISLLASNLKNTQSLLTALQKNLPPNSNLPASIKSLAQRVLSSPLGRAQLQVSANNALRGIVTVTTVPTKVEASPSTPAASTTQPVASVSTVKPETAKQASESTSTPVQKSETVSVTKTSPAVVFVKAEPLTEGRLSFAKSDAKVPVNKTLESPAAKQATLVSALTSPVQPPQQSYASAQHILHTAHLLLQQQGAALSSNISMPEKSSSTASTVPGVSQEMLAHVTSYLNIPSSTSSDSSQSTPLPAKTTSATRPSSVQQTAGDEDSDHVSFLTAALTSGTSVSTAHNPLVSLALATEAFTHTPLPLSGVTANPTTNHTPETSSPIANDPKPTKRTIMSPEDAELASKKPRVEV